MPPESFISIYSYACHCFPVCLNPVSPFFFEGRTSLSSHSWSISCTNHTWHKLMLLGTYSQSSAAWPVLACFLFRLPWSSFQTIAHRIYSDHSGNPYCFCPSWDALATGQPQTNQKGWHHLSSSSRMNWQSWRECESRWDFWSARIFELPTCYVPLRRTSIGLDSAHANGTTYASNRCLSAASSSVSYLSSPCLLRRKVD